MDNPATRSVLILAILVLTFSTGQGCEDGEFLPNDDDCHWYYKCEDGEMVPYQCESGNGWNRDFNTCEPSCMVEQCQGDSDCDEDDSRSCYDSDDICLETTECGYGEYFNTESKGCDYFDTGDSDYDEDYLSPCDDNDDIYLTPTKCGRGEYFNTESEECEYLDNGYSDYEYDCDEDDFSPWDDSDDNDPKSTECGYGEYFNTESEECEYLDTGESTSQFCDEGDIAPFYDGICDYQKCPYSDGYDDTWGTGECEEGDLEDGEYDSSEDGTNVEYRPDSEDCSKYYQCYDESCFQWDCWPGTVYSPDIGACDWPHNVPDCVS